MWTYAYNAQVKDAIDFPSRPDLGLIHYLIYNLTKTGCYIPSIYYTGLITLYLLHHIS